MNEFEPSQTAVLAAMLRAAHQIMDCPRVFEDGLALRIIGEQAQSSLQSLIEASEGHVEHTSLRAFLAARSRYAEEQIACAIRRGVDQCVVLGAGLDTFAYRCADARLRIFEVDHPATQALKQAWLGRANISKPVTLSFVPVDITKTPLKEELLKWGWNANKPCIIACLGVIQYLPSEAVAATLELASSMVRGSEIVFDYAIAPHTMNTVQRTYFENLRTSLAAFQEPLQSCFAPSDLAATLNSMGFSTVDDVTPDDLNAWYFHGREDELRLTTTFSHIARAKL